MDEPVICHKRGGRPKMAGRMVTKEAICRAMQELGNVTRSQIASYLGVTPQIVGHRLREYGIDLPYDNLRKSINSLPRLRREFNDLGTRDSFLEDRDEQLLPYVI